MGRMEARPERQRGHNPLHFLLRLRSLRWRQESTTTTHSFARRMLDLRVISLAALSLLESRHGLRH